MGSYSIFHWLIVFAVIALFAAPVVVLILVFGRSARRKRAADEAPRDGGPW